MRMLEEKVDIGLRTTANTNDTIQKLIEQFQLLEERTEELRLAKVSHHQLVDGAFRKNALLAASDPPRESVSPDSVTVAFDQFDGVTDLSGPLSPTSRQLAVLHAQMRELARSPSLDAASTGFLGSSGALDPVRAMQRRHMDVVAGRLHAVAAPEIGSALGSGARRSRSFPHSVGSAAHETSAVLQL